MQTKQYGEWVNVSEEMPSEELHGKAISVIMPNSSKILSWYYTGTDMNSILFKEQVVEWLKPVTGILLQQQEYEGLMKCAEALKTIEGGYLVNASQIQPFCKQIIAQLPETIK